MEMAVLASRSIGITERARQNPLPLRERVLLRLIEGAGEGEVYDLKPSANRKAPPLPVGAADHPPPQGGRVSQSQTSLERTLATLAESFPGHVRLGAACLYHGDDRR